MIRWIIVPDKVHILGSRFNVQRWSDWSPPVKHSSINAAPAPPGVTSLLTDMDILALYPLLDCVLSINCKFIRGS